jgi:hypothetical protein
MAHISLFPPILNCPSCSTPLRPATRAEVNRDLKDPTYAFIAEQAAQGSMEWEPPANWADYGKKMMPPGSWMLRCDKCGNRTLFSESDC